jgi:hypothetical protein
MEKYWVNNQTYTNPKKNHEVHKESCRYLPSDKKDLGYHHNCKTAMEKAKEFHDDVDGCKVCSDECHSE